MAGAKLSCEPDRASDIDSGRSPDAEPLFLDQIENNRKRFLVRHLIGKVRLEPFKVGRDAALANALSDRVAFGLELTVSVVTEESRTTRIGKCNFYGIALLAQTRSNTSQRSTATDGCNEPIALAAGLLPAFL